MSWPGKGRAALQPSATMRRMRSHALAVLLAASAIAFASAQTESIDYAMLGRIRDEGLNRSQVMDHISWLSDVYGPRLTGSPGNPAGERVGDEDVPRVGARQRPPGALELRQGLVAGALQRAPGRAADPAAHRLPAGMVVGHATARSPPTSSACRSRTKPTSRSTAASSPARSCSRSRRARCACSRARSS